MTLWRLSRVAPSAILALMIGVTADAAWAQTPPTPVPNKGDTAWMMTATVLVLLMTIPGLALFYGGLVRTKNMLSVMTQVFAIACLAARTMASTALSTVPEGTTTSILTFGRKLTAYSAPR